MSKTGLTTVCFFWCYQRLLFTFNLAKLLGNLLGMLMVDIGRDVAFGPCANLHNWMAMKYA